MSKSITKKMLLSSGFEKRTDKIFCLCPQGQRVIVTVSLPVGRSVKEFLPKWSVTVTAVRDDDHNRPSYYVLANVQIDNVEQFNMTMRITNVDFSL